MTVTDVAPVLGRPFADPADAGRSAFAPAGWVRRGTVVFTVSYHDLPTAAVRYPPGGPVSAFGLPLYTAVALYGYVRLYRLGHVLPLEAPE